MCIGGGGGGDAEAARAREESKRQEAERQANIRAGQSAIDERFAQFNDPYYNTYRSAYTENYYPQLEDQYTQARDRLTSALANRGQLEGSVAAERYGELDKRYNQERTAIAQRAEDEANALRGRVEQQRSDLYQYNQSAADPQGVSARAQSEATALVAPQSYSPLGEVFASVLQPLAAYVSADRNSVNPSLGFNKQPTVYTSPTSTNSGRVIS